MPFKERVRFSSVSIVNAAAAFSLSLLISGIFIWLSGGSPLKAFIALAEGSFGSRENLILTLQKSVPLIFTGLSIGIAFKGGLFNIGSEGQLYAGAITAAWIGCLLPDIPGVIKLPFILLVSAAVGGLWGLLPGILKAKKNIHEVLTTILMNYIAIHLTSALVKGPLRGDPALIKTVPLPESSRLPVLAGSGALILSWGLPLAVITACLLWIFLRKTTGGFKLRAVGTGKDAAAAAGFNVKKIIITTMMLGGALSGFGGAIEVTGLHYTFYGQFSPGYGFDGIAVALLANNNPLGIIITAILFGALRAADRTLQLNAGVPHQMVLIIQGLVILFIGIGYLHAKRRKAKSKKNETAPVIS
jgi:simple sugar transport system permease protein